MAGQRIPGPLTSYQDHDVQSGALGNFHTASPGPVGLHILTPKSNREIEKSPEYSYAISGSPGPLGNMFLTEAMTRLPGTWYDHTGVTNQFRRQEALLGASEYASPEFKQMAKRIAANLEHPPDISVDVYFKKDGHKESIEVRGRTGTRPYEFDMDEAKNAKQAPGSDVFQPFYDAIDQLVKLVIEVR